MSGSTPPPIKNVSPIRHNEKPWDQWAAEIGRASPLRDEDPADATKGGVGRRAGDSPRKRPDRAGTGRCGVTRLRRNSMSLYGQFPNADLLDAAVCHMCGMTVKCSAAHRHLSEYHSSSANPILPPPPPAPTVKLKSSHSKSKTKKETLPPPAIVAEPDRLVAPAVTFPEEIRPVAAAVASIAAVVRRENEADRFPGVETPPAIRSGEVEVSVGDDDPPVVSIRESADLPLGDGLADDIMEIMNSEGIRSIEDLPDAAAWKNLMQDFNAVREIDLRNAAVLAEVPPAPDPVYAMGAEGTTLHFATTIDPLPPPVPDRRQNPFPPTPIAMSAPVKPRSGKPSRPKHPAREYDPNRHCGVPSGENRNPCTRSLTCKSHALSLRRHVEGRAKPFDALLAEHRASKPTVPAQLPSVPAPVRTTVMPLAPVPEPPPPPIRTPIESAFAALSPDRTTAEYYSAVVSGDLPASTIIPEEGDLVSLLPPEAAEALTAPPAPPPSPPRPPEPRPQHVYWYPTEPRPLAACGFSTCRMGGALFVGRRLATVRGDLKAALARSRSENATGDYFNFNQNSVPTMTKNIHANSSTKTVAPQVRKSVMSCPAFSGGGGTGAAYGPGKRNGHLFSSKRPLLDDYDDGDAERVRGSGVTKVTKRSASSDMMDLNFMFDPLMADEKC